MFSEIYGSYYYMLEMILAKANEKVITTREIDEIVTDFGFLESSLYFTPDAVAARGGYNLLIRAPNGYTSTLEHPPVSFMTNDQKRFIKTMLADSRAQLFLSNEAINKLQHELSDVEPLYDLNDIIFTETSLDGDPYGDECYRSNFRIVLSAIQQRRMVCVSFDSSKGSRHTVIIAPWKLEYGLRDDKFRLCGVSFKGGKARRYVKVNVARMTAVTVLNQACNIDFEEYIKEKRNHKPIDIIVTNERNGFERVFIGLSNYERISAYKAETGSCTMKIFYTDDDEPELLILLMSFGPVIRVLGPEDFKERYIARIRKQVELLS